MATAFHFVFFVVTCAIIVGFFLRLILLLFAFLLCACQLSELFQCFLLLFNFLYELRSVLSPTSHSIRRCILSHATVKVSHWMMLLFYLRWCYIISVFVLWFAYNRDIYVWTVGLEKFGKRTNTSHVSSLPFSFIVRKSPRAARNAGSLALATTEIP